MGDAGGPFRGRLRREQRTFEAMLALYCRDLHGGRRGALCPECEELGAYARERLARCPFGPAKPTCKLCPVHCYRPAMRERVTMISMMIVLRRRAGLQRRPVGEDRGRGGYVRRA